MFFSFYPLRATQCVAIVDNGNWSDPATWSCGFVPGNNDTMTIPAGLTVNVDINSPTYSNMLVIVDGILNFENGQKINICPGGVMVNAGGFLEGGTPGSKIVICGSDEWRGPGPTGGPVSYGTTPLPIELVSFSGHQLNNTIVLNWTTASETNNNYFTIERSTDGSGFKGIAKVAGSGTSTQQHNYTCTDSFPVNGVNYYRLSQTDFNGHERSFSVIAVNFSCQLFVYPNPVNGPFTVSLCNCVPGSAITLEMIDVTGRIIFSFSPALSANQKEDAAYRFDIPGNLDPGIYFIREKTTNTVYEKKVILK